MKNSHSQVFAGQWADRLRPSSFNDFVLDDATADRIKGLFLSDSPPNCILITGTTGNGKTTLARLVAAKIAGISKKYSKHDHAASRFVFPSDVTEVNCGEDTGKEKIGETIKMAEFRPRTLKRRVILLDEVHKLSHGAISALLKPLEEPPPHTTWILCTNHHEKLNAALKNRAYWINLQDMRSDTALELLAKVTKETGVAEAFPFKANKLFASAAKAALGQRIFTSPREAVTMYQALLAGVAAADPQDIKSAMSALKKATKAAFDDLPEGQDINKFINSIDNDLLAAASIMVNMAREADAFDHLYFSLRSRLQRGTLKGIPALVFAWCVDAKAWSVHSGMLPLDYVAARLVEHNEGR